MHPILLFIIQTSVAGSITGLLYLLLQPLTERVLSARWQYSAVKMLALFFIIPTGFVKPLYVLWQGSDALASPVQAMQPIGANANNLAGNILQPMIAPVLDTLPQGAFPGHAGGILLMIWTAGVFLFALRQVLSYRVFYRKIVRFNNSAKVETVPADKLCNDIALSMGLKRKISVTANPKIQGPMVFFGIRNTIVLPDMPIEWADLKYVFRHELTHIKRHDLLVKFCFLCVGALQWFNPVYYMLRRKLNHWCELSCDEAVVKSFNHEEKKEYGLSIINLMYTGKSAQIMLCSSYACGKKELKRRLNMLIRKRKYLKAKIALSMAFTLVLGAAGITASAMAATLDTDAPGAIQAAQGIVVRETSVKTGIPTIIEWEGNLYMLDNRANMSESADGGASWHDYRSDYDTMAVLYGGFGLEMVTYEEHMGLIEQTKERIANPRPTDRADFVSSLAHYESILPAWEKGEAIEDITQLVKMKSFPFLFPGQPVYDDVDSAGKPVNTAMYGSTLDNLYDILEEQLAHWVTIEMLTQAEADTIWNQFLEQLDI